MSSKNKIRFGAVAAAAVAALAFSVAVPAYADPATIRPLVGVGSDTTQDLVGGLAFAITDIGNYDATGLPALIQTRAGGVSFVRPNGSTAGIQALSASAGNNTGVRTFPAAQVVGQPAVQIITGQVDFARSSSGPNSSFAGTDLTFIPFARDAVTYAVSAASDFPRDIALGAAAQDSLSPAPFTLRNIYRGTVTTYTDGNFNSVTIRPIIPQQGSGTRSFWLSALGLTEGTIVGTPTTDIGNTAQEHNGSYIRNAGDIAPFSIAQYIAQGNYSTLPTSVTERRGNVELGQVGSIKPLLLTAGGGVELNTAFPINRLVYNVVASSRLTGTSPADVLLQQTFVGNTSAVCAASTTIKQYGFGTLPAALCGSTATKQGFRY